MPLCGSSSSRDIKTNFLPYSPVNKETTTLDGLPKIIESVVDIKNTSGTKLAGCSFIANDGNLVNFEVEELKSYKVISVNHKDEIQAEWDVKFVDEKPSPRRLESTVHHIVFSSDLTYVVVVTRITQKKKKSKGHLSNVINMGYSITVYDLPQGENNINDNDICNPVKQQSVFVGKHHVEDSTYPNQVILSQSNILSIGLRRDWCLFAEHYRIDPHSKESCIKLVGHQKIMTKTAYLYFRYNDLGDILICSSASSSARNQMSCFINTSYSDASQGQLSRLVTTYPGRNCYIVFYDFKEYLVCNELEDHEATEMVRNDEFIIKVSQIIRRKNGTFLFKDIFCLDTEPFRKLTICGADSCYERVLVVCQLFSSHHYHIIDLFKKITVYKIDGNYNRIHNISCSYKQIGFSCNEMFFMCSNLSERSFMKCFQLENNFPTLLSMTRNVLLRTYSWDELNQMDLPRICQSILHLPIVEIID